MRHSMKYIIGIDIGTSGTKSVLFDTLGNVIASSSAEYPMMQPNNGWAEENPIDWWEATKKTLKELYAYVTDGEVAGIGLSGQMHSLVLLDKNNEVIRPAILWCDQRTKEECIEIENLIGKERLIEITANPALPGFTASKIMWVKRHEPENFKRTAHVLLAKDYVRYRLTGEYVTDMSDASGMQLLDVPRRKWSEELCEALGIDTSLLPRLAESPEISGYLSNEAAEQTGLKAGIPVAAGGGDNASAAIGVGVCKAGGAFTTIGTSGVVFAPTDTPVIDPKGRVHTFCAAVPGTWHVMGVTQAAGLSLSWFKKTLAPELTYKEIDDMCKSVAIGADGLIYLPYLMGERTPILDSNARGVFFGLSAIHTKAHMARAVLEGISYSLLDCLEVLRQMNLSVDDMAICGGGAKSDLWQTMLSDVYGIGVKTTISSEGAALGAAILGGCAGGVFSSVTEACDAIIKEKSKTLPNSDATLKYASIYSIYKSIYPGLKACFAELSKI